jgi:hypothetical protein
MGSPLSLPKEFWFCQPAKGFPWQFDFSIVAEKIKNKKGERL